MFRFAIEGIPFQPLFLFVAGKRGHESLTNRNTDTHETLYSNRMSKTSQHSLNLVLNNSYPNTESCTLLVLIILICIIFAFVMCICLYCAVPLLPIFLYIILRFIILLCFFLFSIVIVLAIFYTDVFCNVIKFYMH